jgi:PKD domain
VVTSSARPSLCTGASRRALILCALVLASIGALSPAAATANTTPTPTPATTVDGPSAGIVSLNGMSIARDGTGGLVYLKNVGGASHVFVSQLAGGTFQAPVQVDPELAGASSQPVIAAGQGGLLLVAFLNGGALYVVQAVADGPPGAPQALYGDAANPSLSLSNFGKAYLAFTALDGAGGADVRTAFYFQGQWALESGALDADPADAAGTGTGRPQIAAAGDGVGIVVWGEDGQIFSRRVVGITPSVVFERADVPTLDGWQEVSAGDPVISAGGDSSYASVAFQEQLSSGGAKQSRVLMNRLHGSQYDGIEEGDGVSTGGPEGADQPQTAVTEYGAGFVTSELDETHGLYATTLGGNEVFGETQRVDSLPNSAPPDAVPATAGLVSNLIAWQQTPGIAGTAEIRVRYAPDGADLGAEEVVSSPALGATNANRGLVAAGDVAGDAVVAWVQGVGAGSCIVAAQLYQPPGGFVPAHSFSYSTTATPMLAWSGAAELWGSPQYVVELDGAPIAQTQALSLTTPMTDGRHVVQVTAVNQAGLSTAANPATVFVDTVPPLVSLTVRGTFIVKTRQQLSVRYSDPPSPGLATSAASGVATVFVSWGDGTPAARIRRNDAAHVYTRRRRYTITVTVTDRAGNKTVLKETITIKPKPKPKRKKKRKGRKPKVHKAGAAVARLTIDAVRAPR